MNIIEIFILGLALLVLMSAGVIHAWLRNSHVQIGQEIDQIQRSVRGHNDSANSLQVKVEKKLNIYQLQHDLKDHGVPLVKAPASAIEKISPYVPPQTDENELPQPSQVAQGHP